MIKNMKKERTSKLLVGIACLGTLASCNKNINPIVENDYSNYSEYQINNLSDFYSQDEEIYTIYFYDKNDSNCELIKSDILNYLDEYKNDKKHLKLYLYDYSKISDDTSSFLKNNQDYKTNKKYMIENNYIDNIKDTIINRASSLYVIKYNGLIDYYEDKDISEFLFNNNYDSRDYSIFKDYKLDSLDNFYSLQDEKYMIYLYYDQCPYCFKIRGKIYDFLLSEHNIKLYPFNMFSSVSEFGIEYRAKFKNIANNKEEIEKEKNIEINEGVCELKDTLFVGVPALYVIEKNKLNDFICGSEEIVEYINNLK